MNGYKEPWFFYPKNQLVDRPRKGHLLGDLILLVMSIALAWMFVCLGLAF